MQRIRWVRISAMVAAICLIGAIQYSDEVALVAAGLPEPDGMMSPGATQIDEVTRMMVPLAIPFAGDRYNVGMMSFPGPLKCAADERSGAHVCKSRKPNDSSYYAMSSNVRSATGTVQREFDNATSETVVQHVAQVRKGTDRAGHPTEMSARSVLNFSGFSTLKDEVLMNGADTTYKTVQRAKGVNRLIQVVQYSNVRVPSFKSNSRFHGLPYPLSGVVYTTREHQWVTASATRPFYTNAIVYFDGTRTPEAYLDGKRYKLDLHTGLATPYAGA
jgi:hypothetical protein